MRWVSGEVLLNRNEPVSDRRATYRPRIASSGQGPPASIRMSKTSSPVAQASGALKETPEMGSGPGGWWSMTIVGSFSTKPHHRSDPGPFTRIQDHREVRPLRNLPGVRAPRVQGPSLFRKEEAEGLRVGSRVDDPGLLSLGPEPSGQGDLAPGPVTVRIDVGGEKNAMGRGEGLEDLPPRGPAWTREFDRS